MKKITKQLVLIIVSVLAVIVVTPVYASTSDMTHYWNFDEGTGRSIGDFGGQNGVMTGSSTGFGWASGKIGTALALDGMTGEGVVLPDGILSGSVGTLSAWIDMNELSDHNIIFSGRSTTDHNVYVSFSIDHDGRPMVQFRDSNNGNDRRAQGTRLIAKNEWVNVVLTANAIGYHMYVNGEEVLVAGENIGRWFPDLTNQTLSYRIGMLDASPFSGSFNGYIDDVRIYDRVLSLDDVKALYTEGNNSVPTNPVAAGRITLSVSEDHIPSGGSVALNWKAENLDNCTASGGWSGSVATSGSRVFVKLASDVTYHLSCSGKYGVSDSSVSVRVDSETSTVIATSSTGVLTVSEMMTGSGTSASSLSQEVRQAQIKELLSQIVLLIEELKKQLVILKASGGTNL